MKNKKKKYILAEFLLYLNNKGLINNYDFDYQKQAKKYIKAKKKGEF